MMGASFIHDESWPGTPGSLAELTERHEPTVFRSLAEGWVPGSGGDLERILKWLRDTAGHRTVPVSISLPNDRGFMGTGGSEVASPLNGQRTLRAFIDECQRELAAPTGHALYVQSVNVSATLPELEPFLRLPVDRSAFAESLWKIWIGSGQHHVNLHHDGFENFYCVLAGHKRFNLCKFDVINDMYIGSLDGNLYGTPASVVNPKEADLKRYPKFANVLRCLTPVDLEPGDVLYLPCHWWHYVESFGFNCSVNLWWSELTKRHSSMASQAFLSSLLHVRSLPSHILKFWRDAFGHAVFRSAKSAPDGTDTEYDYLDLTPKAGGRSMIDPQSQLRLSQSAVCAVESDAFVWRVRDRHREVRVSCDVHEGVVSFFRPRPIKEALEIYSASSQTPQDDVFYSALLELLEAEVLINWSDEIVARAIVSPALAVTG